jgi:opacity protein-like surface antigen
LSNWFGVAGDFGVYHLSQSGTSANTFTFLAGPRLSANRGKSVSPFVQALVGGDRLTLSGFGSAHGFSWSTGGGVDLAVSRHIAIRPQFDYIGLRFSNGTTHSARASVSIVFRFGGH